jgi:hypothetical protein
MTEKVSHGKVADAWDELDRYLKENRYMRLSLVTGRNPDHATKREWSAVVFMESGKVVVRTRARTRDIAIVQVAYDMMLLESSKKS